MEEEFFLDLGENLLTVVVKCAFHCSTFVNLSRAELRHKNLFLIYFDVLMRNLSCYQKKLGIHNGERLCPHMEQKKPLKMHFWGTFSREFFLFSKLFCSCFKL